MSDLLKLIRKKKYCFYIRCGYIIFTICIITLIFKFHVHITNFLSGSVYATSPQSSSTVEKRKTPVSSQDHVVSALIMEINRVLKSLDKIEERWKKDQDFIKMLESMHPKKAAKRLDLLDKSTLSYIFSNISKKKGAMILEYLSPEKTKDVLNCLAGEKIPTSHR
jgi:hypothetical protein